MADHRHPDDRCSTHGQPARGGSRIRSFRARVVEGTALLSAPPLHSRVSRECSKEASMIRKTAKGYVLYSKDGSKKLGGPYRTRAGALKRERQVQFFKHAKGSGG